MSDFLRQLIQRALAPSAALQPRLASRFEPGFARSRFTEERIETIAASPRARAPESPAASATPAPVPRAEGSPSVARALSLAPAMSVAPPPVTPPLPAPPVVTPSHPPFPGAPDRPREAAPPVSPSPPVTTRPEWLSLPTVPAGTLLVERFTETVREARLAPGASIPPAEVVRSPAVSALLMPPALHPPSIAPGPPSVVPVGEAAETTSAAEIIRVNIGRIDIRAVHAPPAAPVRAPAPAPRPVLSLETYLSRRNAR